MREDSKTFITLTLFMLGLTWTATNAQCPYPFTNEHNGYTTSECYYYAGTAATYKEASASCKNMRHALVMPKTEAGLTDLYYLLKAYPNYYFWVNIFFFLVQTIRIFLFFKNLYFFQ
jgi:hypothetical protein